MKPAGSVVFSWTGREAAVWASHATDPLADAEFRQAAVALQRNVTGDGRHRCAPSGKTLCVAAAFGLRRLGRVAVRRHPDPLMCASSRQRRGGLRVVSQGDMRGVLRDPRRARRGRVSPGCDAV